MSMPPLTTQASPQPKLTTLRNDTSTNMPVRTDSATSRISGFSYPADPQAIHNRETLQRSLVLGQSLKRPYWEEPVQSIGNTPGFQGSSHAHFIPVSQGKCVHAAPETVEVLTGIPSLAPVADKTVAVLFAGGPATGGHNVLAGLKSVLPSNLNNQLLGVTGGPQGLLDGKVKEITEADIETIINTPGFHFLGTGRTPLTEDGIPHMLKTLNDNHLDGLVVVGGDGSNASAAFLSKKFQDAYAAGKLEKPCCVIGVPKTIDGDFQFGNVLPITFGFDSATKFFSEAIHNLMVDTRSNHKYWHFIKLMGRDSSHITLEVALQTHPNAALISEEVGARKMSLKDIVDYISQKVIERSDSGKNYGMVLIPEGVTLYISEFNQLIDDLDKVNLKLPQSHRTQLDRIENQLLEVNESSYHLFKSLPDQFALQLIQRDTKGRLNLSILEIEKLLADKVEARVRELKPEIPFKSRNQTIGHEGRTAKITHFDANYAFNLGYTAASLIADQKSGFVSAVTDLNSNASHPMAINLQDMMEMVPIPGTGTFRPKVPQTMVDLNSPAFTFFTEQRDNWVEKDGIDQTPADHIQPYFGHQIPITVALNQGYASLHPQVDGGAGWKLLRQLANTNAG